MYFGILFSVFYVCVLFQCRFGVTSKKVRPMPIRYAVTVTPDVVKFGGRCVVCCFRVNGGHGTDGRTDGRDITRNVASMGRTAKYRNKYSFIV